jgi:hypothetical protein
LICAVPPGGTPRFSSSLIGVREVVRADYSRDCSHGGIFSPHGHDSVSDNVRWRQVTSAVMPSEIEQLGSAGISQASFVPDVAASFSDTTLIKATAGITNSFRLPIADSDRLMPGSDWTGCDRCNRHLISHRRSSKLECGSVLKQTTINFCLPMG